ncbi:MAG TPA: nickel insertion protein [Halanaerobiales bacterium]|nr:nickel insertion protein [Halanaerobiales bacterium]
MNPEFYDYLMDELFAKGALDVYFTPIQMKKNRPAIKLSVLYKNNEKEIVNTIFKESSSLGIRFYRNIERVCLERKYKTVTTKWGKVKVKLAYNGEELVNIAPEYEECKKLAEKENVSLKKIYQEAISKVNNQ